MPKQAFSTENGVQLDNTGIVFNSGTGAPGTTSGGTVDSAGFAGNEGITFPNTLAGSAEKEITMSLWFYVETGSEDSIEFLATNNDAVGSFHNTFQKSGNNMILRLVNASQTPGYNANVANITGYEDAWHHIIMSASFTTNELYVFYDGVDQNPSMTSFVNNHDMVMNVTPIVDRALRLTGRLAQLFFTNEFIDLSVPANLAKFYNNGYVDFAGTNPTGSAPLFFVEGDETAILTNTGSTGGVGTEVGTLTTEIGPEGPAPEDAYLRGSLWLDDATGFAYQKDTAGAGTDKWSRIANQDDIDSISSGSSWKLPVEVKDDTSQTLDAAETTMNTGTVDGASVASGDRILYTGLNSPFGAARFDGTDEVNSNGGGTVGTDTDTQITIAMWLKIDTIGSAGQDQTIVEFAGSGANHSRIWINDTINGSITIEFYDNTGTLVLKTQSSPFNWQNMDGQWKHWVWSFDLTNAANEHAYINGAAHAMGFTTYDTGGTFDLNGLVSLGSNADGTDRLIGDIGQVWIRNEYIDLSVQANRQKFYNNGGIDYGALDPTGNAPAIFLRGDGAGLLTNEGSMSDMVMGAGTLTASATAPFTVTTDEDVYEISGTVGAGATLVAQLENVDGNAVWVAGGNTAPDTIWFYGGSSWLKRGSGDQDELAFIRSFIGKGAAGSETPAYTNENYIADGDSLEEAISKLDGQIKAHADAIALIGTQTDTAIPALTPTTVDSVLMDNVAAVYWLVFVEGKDGDVGKNEAYEVYASHNGYVGADATDIDHATYSKVKAGGNMAGKLRTFATGSGASQTLVLQYDPEGFATRDVKVVRKEIQYT